MRLTFSSAVLLAALISAFSSQAPSQALDKVPAQDFPIDDIDRYAKDRKSAKCVVIAEVKAISDVDITADKFKFLLNEHWNLLLKDPETRDGVKAKKAALSIVESVRGDFKRRDEIDVYYVDYTLGNIIMKAPMPLVLQAKEAKIEMVLLFLNPVGDKEFIPATGTYQSAPSCDYLYKQPRFDR